MSEEDFKKYDSGKLEYDLLPVGAVEAVVQIMMYGAYKKGYGKNNWQKCKDTSRYYNALRRHLEQWRAGELVDEESGLPHLAHAACNIMFMHYLEEEKRKNDKA